MKLLARLLEEMIWDRREERSDEDPKERSQFPNIDCMTSIGK